METGNLLELKSQILVAESTLRNLAQKLQEHHEEIRGNLFDTGDWRGWVDQPTNVIDLADELRELWHSLEEKGPVAYDG